MTETAEDAPPPAAPERRTLRWLLGGQIALAVGLILIDLVPTLPQLLDPPSSAPALETPTRPGDQTRRYRPGETMPAGPGTDGDMPRRLLAETVETADGPALRLRGTISPGDGARIAAELRRSEPPLVLLHSPGGSVGDALEIGRALRDLGAETRLAEDAICLSACPYVFVGGTVRTVADGARLGVHQHSFGESTLLPAFLAVEDIQRGQAEVLAHLTAMGIDPLIMGPALATPPDEIYILSAEELTEWRVVTEG